MPPDLTTASCPEFDFGPEPGADPVSEMPAGGADPGADPASDLMSREEFFELFCGLIESPNVALYLKGEKPLESLVVDPGDPAARKASDALYKTCLRVRWLRWMLAPEAEWLKDIMAVGVFSIGRFRLVRLEVEARYQAGRPADPPGPGRKRPAPGAPDDGAPGVDQGVTELKVGGDK